MRAAPAPGRLRIAIAPAIVAIAPAIVALAALPACERGGASSASRPGPAAASVASADGAPGKTIARVGDGGDPFEPQTVEELDPREADGWSRALAGDEDELPRLANALGCEGLRQRAGIPRLRAVALRAMGSCDDLSELGWLAQVATTGPDGEAAAALDAIVDEAARRRRSVDPEDADELAEGCASLLGLARATDRPRARRVEAVRALRMLAERGCLKPADIPAELDSK